MRVLGLDLGQRRIGLAVSDPEGIIAFPAGTLERSGLEADLRALQDLIRERGVERIVVGLPVHMNGKIGREAEKARAFAHTLAEATQLPVDTLDERWTTREAEAALRETGQRGAAKRGVVDSVAAALILSTYLARLG